MNGGNELEWFNHVSFFLLSQTAFPGMSGMESFDDYFGQNP